MTAVYNQEDRCKTQKNMEAVLSGRIEDIGEYEDCLIRRPDVGNRRILLLKKLEVRWMTWRLYNQEDSWMTHENKEAVLSVEVRWRPWKNIGAL
jgi:hypothetical protein